MDHRSRKSWFGIGIGLLFLSIGLAAAYSSAGKMVVGYISSSHWVEVPASIHSVKLITKHGDTTTYSVASSYSYQFNGVTFNSDRVSLSTGSDNIGDYWENLERSLREARSSNEAVALVNPQDPTHSLLDRTFRWKSLVFGSVFLCIFGGIGVLFLWASMRGTKTRKARLQDEKMDGISCDQKTSAWFLAAFGSVFFIMGTGMALITLPDALREGEYAALLILLFVFLGVGIVYYAFKIHRAYMRFGPTPLFLDPLSPGVGGQLGGQFDINIPGVGHRAGSQTPLQARLTCCRVSKSSDSTDRSVKWFEDAPVYLKETVEGLKASFLFDIPESCLPTNEPSNGLCIEWSLSVEGEFSNHGLGKFERSWVVVVEEQGDKASRAIRIPESFIQTAKQRTQQRVKASVLNQIELSEDAQYITVLSKANRGVMGKLMGILFGAAFFAIGVFTVMQGWWLGYLFSIIGGIVLLFSIHSLGKSIVVTIDKNTQELYARESWFGIYYSNKKGKVLDSNQFKLKLTSSSTSNNRVMEYFAVNFKTKGKKIRIADGIKGKKEAIALVNELGDCLRL